MPTWDEVMGVMDRLPESTMRVTSSGCWFCTGEEEHGAVCEMCADLLDRYQRI